jgi:hypothetical protein
MAAVSKKRSEATKRKMSAAAKGKKNPFYGERHSAQWKKRESAAKSGKKNPMYGKHHSLATIRKMRQAALGR